jgi:hypothetical protein
MRERAGRASLPSGRLPRPLDTRCGAVALAPATDLRSVQEVEACFFGCWVRSRSATELTRSGSRRVVSGACWCCCCCIATRPSRASGSSTRCGVRRRRREPRRCCKITSARCGGRSAIATGGGCRRAVTRTRCRCARASSMSTASRSSCARVARRWRAGGPRTRPRGCARRLRCGAGRRWPMSPMRRSRRARSRGLRSSTVWRWSSASTPIWRSGATPTWWASWRRLSGGSRCASACAGS